MEKQLKILIAEDDEGLQILIRDKLEKSGISVFCVSSGNEFLKQLPLFKPDLLLLDYKLPDCTGLELLEKLKTEKIDIPFIVVTGHGDEMIAVRMMKMGAADYIIKDIKFLEFLPDTIKKVAKDIYIKEKLQQMEQALSKSEAGYKLLANNIADVIWTANLEQKFTYASPSVEKLLGYTQEEFTRLNLNDILTDEAYEKVKSVFNQMLASIFNRNQEMEPVRNLEFQAVRKDKQVVWTELSTGLMYNDKNDVIGILSSMRDIQVRKVAEFKLKESLNKLYEALIACIHAMGKTTEFRDPYTADHQNKVAKLAYKLAREMNLSDEICNCVKLSGDVHDIGKISIPSEILSKPGKLNDNEYKLIKNHPGVGYDILRTIEFPWPIAEIVYQHHERFNGSGYPRGLKGNDILIESRILIVADVVEAMASHRPYRPALGLDKAKKEIMDFKGTLYDPDVVDNCIALLNKDNLIFD